MTWNDIDELTPGAVLWVTPGPNPDTRRLCEYITTRTLDTALHVRAVSVYLLDDPRTSGGGNRWVLAQPEEIEVATSEDLLDAAWVM